MPYPRNNMLGPLIGPPNSGPVFGAPNALYSMANPQSDTPYVPYSFNALAGIRGYGMRENGTAKGRGWMGELPRPDGGMSSELSAGVNIGGKETLIPLIVPTLTKQEVDWLLNEQSDGQDFYKRLPRSILVKAVDHATQRINQGLSPFKD